MTELLKKKIALFTSNINKTNLTFATQKRMSNKKSRDTIKQEHAQLKALCQKEVTKLESDFKLSSVKKYLTIYRKSLCKSINNSDLSDNLRKFKKINSEALESEKEAISLIRNRKEQKIYLILRYLNLSIKKQAIIKEATTKSRQQKIINVVHVNKIDIQPIINKAIELCKSPFYVRQLIGLCLLTGRRPYEIVATAKFTKVDNNHVEFKGQSKTKNSELGRDNYEIPTLTSSDFIISTLKKFRNHTSIKKLKNQTSTHINKIISKNCINSVRTHFDHIKENIQTKDLRALYASMAYELFRPVNNKGQKLYTKPMYYSLILGHSKNDQNTAITYTQFEINNEK